MNQARIPVIATFLWVFVFAMAFVAPRLIEATGDGFTRGMNRLGAFLLWQLGAFAISVFLAVFTWTVLKPKRWIRWVYSIPLLLHLCSVLLIVGFIAYSNMSKPPASAYVPPGAPTAVAEPVPEREFKSYSGIFKSGFEMSHFYTMDGQGPWWLESNDSDWQTLQSYYVEGPGRSGGVTVALQIEAYVSEIGPGFNHLAPIGTKIHVVSINSIRSLSEDEFGQLLEAIQK